MSSGPSPGADVALAMALVAVDPSGLAGLVLRGGPGPIRDQVCGWIGAVFKGSPVVRVPCHVTEDRLLGGLSLPATLRSGRPVTEKGLLDLADGGVIVVPMAERLDGNVTSCLCATIDRGEVALERDGLTSAVRCRSAIVALDEGLGDERIPAALADRLAIHLDLSALDPRVAVAGEPDVERVRSARGRVAEVTLDANLVRGLCAAASALGIDSMRASVLAARVACAHAALDGRTTAEEVDAIVAARLVLGPRATRLPATPEAAAPTAAPLEEREVASASHSDSRDDDDASGTGQAIGAVEDLVLAAATSAVPPGLLGELSPGRHPRTTPPTRGRAGAVRSSLHGGRPSGVRPGTAATGERLNLVETLRAAAPWQRLRRRESELVGRTESVRVQVRKSDFRVTRFRQRTETSVIFAVDASGSAALQRLAEAKGAVEQILSDCYARRDDVALVAFRGHGATLLLPSTRSLTRVRRRLADLAGGGTTPLASGIDLALTLAIEARRSGKTPVLVVMTDGRANVARDGREGGPAATADATSSARAVRAAGVRTLFLDTAPRPRAQARVLAEEMAARYLPLPYVDALGISRQVRSLAGGMP